MSRVLDEEAFQEAAGASGVAPTDRNRAWQQITHGQVVLLGVNGKLASGKDTIAPKAMAALGASDPVHEYFARALKDEVDGLIADVLDRGSSPRQAVARAAGSSRPEVVQAGQFLQQAIDAGGPGVSARDRTAQMRRLLQHWGSEVRRAQDPQYWVNMTVRSCLLHAAAGRSVYITDARFPNEVRGCQGIGFTMVRLQVSPVVQAERHLARDGVLPDPAALTHPSETSLDDYDGFDLVVDNDGPQEAALAAIVGLMGQRAYA